MWGVVVCGGGGLSVGGLVLFVFWVGLVDDCW